MDHPLCQTTIFPINTVVVNGFGLMILCCFGLFGNCVCLTILIRTYLGSTIFRNYLSALCVADSLTLLSCLFMFVIPILTNFTQMEGDVQTLVNHLIVIFYPIGTVAENASTLLTAAISAVRFSGVIYPFQTRLLNSSSFARTVIAGMYLFAGLFNIPRLLELNLTPCVYRNHFGDNETMLQLDITSLRNAYSYKVCYMILTKGLVMFFIPFCVILVCNCAVAYRFFIDGLGRNGDDLPRHRPRCGRADMTTKLLVFMCFFFVICHIMPLMVSSLETGSFLLEQQILHPDTYSFLVDISNFLVAVKASSNFLFYMLFNRKFRTLILRQND